MNKGFCGYYGRNGQVHYAIPDSDGNCDLDRLADRLPGGYDEKTYIQFGCDDWSARSFGWYPYGYYPAWLNDNARRRVISVMDRVYPHVIKFRWIKHEQENIYHESIHAASVAYDRTINQAQMEYTRLMDKLDAALYNDGLLTRCDYNQQASNARDKYIVIRRAAEQELKRVGDQAALEYNHSIHAAMVAMMVDLQTVDESI